MWTSNMFYYTFSTICARDNLTFCSLIMFMIEIIYAVKNIKNLLTNHCFNHVAKFLTLPRLYHCS